MKVEKIRVNKKLSPIDVLARIGDKTRNALILFDGDAFSQQMRYAPRYSGHYQDERSFYWEEDIFENRTPHKSMHLKSIEEMKLYLVTHINSDAVAFTVIPKNPEAILYVTMN